MQHYHLQHVHGSRQGYQFLRTVSNGSLCRMRLCHCMRWVWWRRVHIMWRNHPVRWLCPWIVRRMCGGARVWVRKKNKNSWEWKMGSGNRTHGRKKHICYVNRTLTTSVHSQLTTLQMRIFREFRKCPQMFLGSLSVDRHDIQMNCNHSGRWIVTLTQFLNT